MDQQFDTTFIPKSPLLQDERTAKRKEPISLTTFVSLIIFFVTLMVAGGVYFLRHTLEGEVATLEKEMKAKEAEYDVTKIDELTRIDKRLRLARGILEKHIAVNSLFDLFVANTLQVGTFKDFQYEFKDGEYRVRASGSVPSFAALARQADVFRAHPLVKNVTVSSPNIEEQTGNVLFGMELVVSPDIFSYVNQVNGKLESQLKSPLTAVPGSVIPPPVSPTGG